VIGKTLEQVANELDIDREGALGGRVYREFSSTVHVVETGIPYDPMLSSSSPPTTASTHLGDLPAGRPDEVRAIGIVEMGDLFDTSATPEKVAGELRRYASRCSACRPRARDAGVDGEWPAVGDPAGHAGRSRRPAVGARLPPLGFVFGRPPSG
jgi:hypothetical protein